MSRFCDECDVSLDLHPNGKAEDDTDCRIAEAKASLLDRFGRPFVPTRAAASSPSSGAPEPEREA